MVGGSAHALANLGSPSSLARTALLLAGALLCLSVAAWPVLSQRRRQHPETQEQMFAGTNVPYAAPPQRRQSDGGRLTIAALICAAGFVAAIWLPSKSTMPARPLVALPGASAIAPGTGIAVTYADGSGGMGCTAGFLVRTNAGRTGILTAGHCNKEGEASKVSINYSAGGGYVNIGTFSQSVSEGLNGEAHDIGLITLDSGKIPQSPAIKAAVPVTGIATDLKVGQLLCKFGMKTGRAECGQVTDISASKVAFLAASECGDSGGPVYRLDDDGTAVAVGILIRAGHANDPHPGCSTPATFSISELVRPWLDRWSLTAITEPGSP
ncbi:S1 family peptidase [Mycobacterium ulcerans]|uniref:S1 family peptidase n=1 Tax=Mycobacterium ulcerans TaxID=1809 RepID=UPI00106CC992|nr:S1 family peptidase [Mycobacterium ulcerans]